MEMCNNSQICYFCILRALYMQKLTLACTYDTHARVRHAYNTVFLHVYDTHFVCVHRAGPGQFAALGKISPHISEY